MLAAPLLGALLSATSPTGAICDGEGGFCVGATENVPAVLDCSDRRVSELLEGMIGICDSPPGAARAELRPPSPTSRASCEALDCDREAMPLRPARSSVDEHPSLVVGAGQAPPRLPSVRLPLAPAQDAESFVAEPPDPPPRAVHAR